MQGLYRRSVRRRALTTAVIFRAGSSGGRVLRVPARPETDEGHYICTAFGSHLAHQTNNSVLVRGFGVGRRLDDGEQFPEIHIKSARDGVKYSKGGILFPLGLNLIPVTIRNVAAGELRLFDDIPDRHFLSLALLVESSEG